MCEDVIDDIADNGLQSLSESRLDSLSYFATKTESSAVILLLREYSSDIPQLQAAYIVAEHDVGKKIYNKRYNIPESARDVDAFYNFVAYDLREILEIETLPRCSELNYRSQSLPYKVENTGLVVYFSEAQAGVPQIAKIAAKLLCKELELSRSLRVSDAIRMCQKIAQEEWRDQYDTLNEVCKIVRHSLNCKGVKSFGFDRDHRWRSIEPEIDGESSEIIDLDINVSHSQRTKIKNEFGNECDALLVPIHRPYIALSAQKFQSMTEFLRGLSPELQAHQAVLYYNKCASTYLQSNFSSTDQVICDRVFYSIQAFLAAKDFQESYSSTLESLTSSGDRSFPSYKRLRQMIKDISAKFVDIGVINVSREAESFNIFVDNDYSVDVFSEDYFERLEKNYLRPFFEKQNDSTPDEIYVGVDQDENSFRIEIHFSSHHNDTKIFVVKCNENFITEASIRSIVHLFSDLHLRYQRVATLAERADYITQVRHVVVHHLSSTLSNLVSIQSTWKAAEKKEHLWRAMRRDVDFPRFLDQGIGNLTRATQILELGRFMIEEIDPSTLNKKPFDPVSIINETFSLLSYNIRKKRLIPKSTVTGSRPSIMNGDEELLRIAFLNLIDNAVKYSAVGKKIEWKINFHKDHYKFEITNVGNPIREEQKEKLLHTRFRSAQLDHLNQRHGTGWGLPVSAKILRAHSKRAVLDFNTVLNEIEPINSENVFFFEMPYKTGVVSQAEQELQDAAKKSNQGETGLSKI